MLLLQHSPITVLMLDMPGAHLRHTAIMRDLTDSLYSVFCILYT